MEAGELRRPVGPAENGQDAPDYFTLSSATQNLPAGCHFSQKNIFMKKCTFREDTIGEMGKILP